MQCSDANWQDFHSGRSKLAMKLYHKVAGKYEFNFDLSKDKRSEGQLAHIHF